MVHGKQHFSKQFTTSCYDNILHVVINNTITISTMRLFDQSLTLLFDNIRSEWPLYIVRVRPCQRLIHHRYIVTLYISVDPIAYMYYSSLYLQLDVCVIKKEYVSTLVVINFIGDLSLTVVDNKVALDVIAA